MSSLRRFLHIERSRAASPGVETDASGTAGRIEGVESPGRDAGAPARSGAGLDRFAPPPPPALELDLQGAGERPFTRCQRCGMDHNLSATECTACGARLDTEDQRAFNEALWAERRAEATREAAADAERLARRGRDAAEDAALRQGAAEELAREVGAAERRRLDAALGAGGGLLDVVRAAGGVAGRLLGRVVTWIVRN